MESALVGLGGTASIRASSSRCSHLLTPSERHTSHLPTIPIGISRYVHSSSGDAIKEYGHPRRLGEGGGPPLHNNPEHRNLLRDSIAGVAIPIGRPSHMYNNFPTILIFFSDILKYMRANNYRITSNLTGKLYIRDPSTDNNSMLLSPFWFFN